MRSKGFAIIELLVVIMIVGLLVAIAISNFPKVKLQLSLLRTTNKFAGDIRKAQQMALSGSVYRNSSGVEQEISGYGVHIDINDLGNKKYAIYADKDPGNKEYDNSDYLVESIDFSSSEAGIVIKEINNVSSNNVSVNFNLSKIETTINQLNFGQKSVEIIFALESNQDVVKSVFINTSGLIEIK